MKNDCGFILFYILLHIPSISLQLQAGIAMGNLLPCDVIPGIFQRRLVPTLVFKSGNSVPKTTDTQGC